MPRPSGDSCQSAALEAWPARFERNNPYSPTLDNRPAPLDRGRLPLTRDHDSQMSFGERAAFEGVLAQVQPRLAIEIGTAEGGSLRRMAAHCRHVYSIDIDHTPVIGGVPNNVELHTGDSAHVLPQLLRSLTESGQNVDVTLVDGDHSYDGVRRDLQNLMSWSCMGNAVILVHDTMNAEVRAGIESVSLERHPRVIYIELDFVPGYVYGKGIARNMAWGGLGLVLTGPERAGDYVASPRQDLYYEPFHALHCLRATQLAQREPPVAPAR
jgi:hypothetical protein